MQAHPLIFHWDCQFIKQLTLSGILITDMTLNMGLKKNVSLLYKGVMPT